MQNHDNHVKVKIDIIKNIICNKKNEMDTMFDNLIHDLNITDSDEIDVLTDYCYNNHINPSFHNICNAIQNRILTKNKCK